MAKAMGRRKMPTPLTIAMSHQPVAIAAVAIMAGAGCSRAPAAKPAAPNILLVTIDTWRADRLGIGISPNLDRLAANGVRFTAARTAAPLTLPSHTTILTGLLPPAHGVRENGIDVLSEARPTIARMLKNAGYRTAAFVGAYVLDRRFGLANGFDSYNDRIARDPNATERLEAERPASAVVDASLAWLNQQDQRRTRDQGPFFLWIHLYDPHAPYSPPAEFRGRTKSPYDDATLRVPLVIIVPGHAASVRDEAVSLADVSPTILRAANVTPPGEMKGRELLGAMGGTGTDLYAETEYPRVAGWSPLQALTDGRWMTIRAGSSTTPGAPAPRTTEVYDLTSDPQQLQNLATAQRSIATAMSARIDAIRASAGAAATREISPQAAERLRALGYVAGTASGE